MNALDAIGSALATLRNRWDDALIEQRLNIRTTGRKDVDVADSVPYSTLAYHAIERVLDRLDLREDDVFIDIGCGKGRVVCAAARRRMKKVTGIDIDATLCADARTNAANLRGGLTPIEIVHGPAERFNYENATALFMFNPFNFATLKKVVDALVASRTPDSPLLRLAYVNPRCESVLDACGRFERHEHWKAEQRGRLKFAVSFWRWRG